MKQKKSIIGLTVGIVFFAAFCGGLVVYNIGGGGSVPADPVQLLPAKDSYNPGTQIAKLTGMPYSDYAKYILKVSYNIGADTSLLLFGLNHGVDNMANALSFEAKNLVSSYGVPPNQFHFVDGSGGKIRPQLTLQ